MCGNFVHEQRSLHTPAFIYSPKVIISEEWEFQLPMTAKVSDASLSSSVPNKLLPLELCRGLAALLVACLHAGASIDKYYGYDIGVVHNFGAGVDFFFVLSGFVITYAHWRDIGRPERVKTYYIKRFLRIYPPYWIVTAG